MRKAIMVDLRPRFERSIGYLPPQERMSLFLSPRNYRKIFQSKNHFWVFVISKIALLIIAIGILPFVPIFIGMSLIALLILIAALLDKELVRNINKNDHPPPEVQPLTQQKPGWYDDPWAFGKVGSQRYWDGINWSTEVRISEHAR